MGVFGMILQKAKKCGGWKRRESGNHPPHYVDWKELSAASPSRLSSRGGRRAERREKNHPPALLNNQTTNSWFGKKKNNASIFFAFFFLTDIGLFTADLLISAVFVSFYEKMILADPFWFPFYWTPVTILRLRCFILIWFLHPCRCSSDIAFFALTIRFFYKVLQYQCQLKQSQETDWMTWCNYLIIWMFLYDDDRMPRPMALRESDSLLELMCE